MSTNEPVVPQEPVLLSVTGHFNPEWISWYRKKHGCGFSEALGIATIRRRKLTPQEYLELKPAPTKPSSIPVYLNKLHDKR